MPNDLGNYTVEDLVAANANDLTGGTMDYLLPKMPELSLIPGYSLEGTSFKQSYITELGKGGYRQYNTGVSISKSKRKNERLETALYGIPVKIDADLAKDPEINGAKFLAQEVSDTVRGSLNDICTHFYYGKPTASDFSHPGLFSIVEKGMRYDAAANGAGTDNEAAIGAAGAPEWRGSIYIIVEAAGLYAPGVSWLFGGGENAFTGFGEFKERLGTDADGNELPLLENYWSMRPGVKHTEKSCVIMHNVSDVSGVTDTMISDALEMLPANLTATKIMMPKKARRALRLNRTNNTVNVADLKGGGDKLAPQPTDVDDVPIHVTDSLLTNEKFITI